MLEITDIKLSKNVVATGEKFTISVEITELFKNAKKYHGKYGYRYTGVKKFGSNIISEEVPEEILKLEGDRNDRIYSKILDRSVVFRGACPADCRVPEDSNET